MQTLLVIAGASLSRAVVRQSPGTDAGTLLEAFRQLKASRKYHYHHLLLNSKPLTVSLNLDHSDPSSDSNSDLSDLSPKHCFLNHHVVPLNRPTPLH